MTHESAMAVAPWAITVTTPLAELDDAALVTAAVAGRREAFDVIVDRHRRAVYQVCYRFVNNHEDASDLAQDTFVRAWKAEELQGAIGPLDLAPPDRRERLPHRVSARTRSRRRSRRRSISRMCASRARRMR